MRLLPRPVKNEMSAANLCLESENGKDFCAEAFKNTYFRANDLQHKPKSWQQCYEMTVLNSKTGKPYPRPRYAKKCWAVRKAIGGEEIEVPVFLSMSIYYQKKENLKYYVFFENDKKTTGKGSKDTASDPIKVEAFLINAL